MQNSKTHIDLFDYKLPKELIAHYPAKMRDKCRLMILDCNNSSIKNGIFSDIISYLDDNSFLVVNNTKVFNARIYATKTTGGKSEVFVTEVLPNKLFKGLVRGKFKSGDSVFVDSCKIELIEKDNDGIWLLTSNQDIESIMEKSGHIPLPPYINREDTIQDKNDYQTIFANKSGSAAAPTAGLHFTTDLINSLKLKGVEVIEITLNVGIGTFRPVKTEYLEDHIMHKEDFFISEESAYRINTLKAQGKKLTAVGSTCVRTLESAVDSNGSIKAGAGSSNLFIKPPYKFNAVDNIITNFHLPKSTLLAMIIAFGGYDFVMSAYEKAVQEKYRFFSYGDAMYIKGKK